MNEHFEGLTTLDVVSPANIFYYDGRNVEDYLETDLP